MNKKENKAMLKAILQNSAPQRVVRHFEVDSDNYDIEFKNHLDLADCERYVNFVLAFVLDQDENGNTIHHPERLSTALFAAKLRFYTDIDITELNLNDLNQMKNDTYFFEFIEDNEVIDERQEFELASAISEKIDFILKNSQKTSFDILLDKITAYFDNMEKSFSGVSQDDISNFVKNIAQIKEVNEESLVSAVVNQLPNKNEDF